MWNTLSFYKAAGILGMKLPMLATIWWKLRESGLDMQRYSDISDDELDSIIGQFQRELWAAIAYWILENPGDPCTTSST